MKQTLLNIFKIVSELPNFITLIIPAISGGVNGFPPDKFANLLFDYLENSFQNKGNLKRIVLIDFNLENSQAFGIEFDKRFGREVRQQLVVNGMEINIVKNDLLKEDVDAIGKILREMINFSLWCITEIESRPIKSNIFCRKRVISLNKASPTGTILQSILSEPKKLKKGTVSVTSKHQNLRCKYVLNAVSPKCRDVSKLNCLL